MPFYIQSCLIVMDSIVMTQSKLNSLGKDISEKAEHGGSSFEFSTSLILTQGKSEIQNSAKRWVIITLQLIR